MAQSRQAEQPVKPSWAALMVLAGLLLSACEAPQTVPEGTTPPDDAQLRLGCVETFARKDPAVRAVETKAPASGPAAGAAGYLEIRFKRGGTITITNWPDEAAADTASRRYQKADEHTAGSASRHHREPVSIEGRARELIVLPTSDGAAEYSLQVPEQLRPTRRVSAGDRAPREPLSNLSRGGGTECRHGGIRSGMRDSAV